MPLFPQLEPTYYTEKDRDILSRMSAFYAESITINQSFWNEADVDTRFEAGDQSLWNEMYGNLPAHRRRQFNFNRIRRVINMISGHQRRTRKSTIVVPVENGDSLTADQFTKILMWIDQQEGVSETISEAFHGALVCGMNLLQVWVDYRNDPISGNIRLDNCSYNSFLIDPFFRKADLSDCNAIWKRSYLTKRAVLSLLPDKEDEIVGLMGRDSRDGKFQFMPENYNYDAKNLMSYDEYYYRDYRLQKMLVDTQTGETQEWRSDDNEALTRFMAIYPQITVIEQTIPTVRVAIVVQGKVMYDGPNPLGTDNYPFVPVFAYYRPQIPYFPWRIQGVVRGLRDAQYLYNRRKVIELDILESQVNSGFKFKENALVDPKDVYLFGQGRGLALKEEAQMTDVEQIQPPQIPPSMLNISEILGREIMEISGINEELLGSANDDKAGILAQLRQGAGLTTLQSLFDQLDQAQKLLGKLMIDIIQSNFTPGKVKRIIAEEPSQQFYNKAFGTYDAAVEEGFNTATQRQLHFAQLLQLREIGIPVPDEHLIEAATVQDKNKLIEAIQQAKQQQSQMEQSQAQTVLEEQQARIRLANATATANEGLGLERASRIQENQAMAVERRASAIRDQESGALDLIKAAQEIQGVDIENIKKVLTLAEIIKRHEMTHQGQPFEAVPPVAPTEPVVPSPNVAATSQSAPM